MCKSDRVIAMKAVCRQVSNRGNARLSKKGALLASQNAEKYLKGLPAKNSNIQSNILSMFEFLALERSVTELAS